MDPFTNGLHCIYDHIHHTFIPSQPDDTSAIGQAACDSASLEQRQRQEKPELFDDLHPASGNGDYYATESGTAALERIRRPRNAFMIFRSEFLAGNKLKSEVEHDNRHISRIAGHCWNSMTEVEKNVYHVKADQEKIAHMRRFPNYKFTPVARRQKPLKRKVKRNGDDELSRCRRVAELLLEGKEGDELVLAVKNADLNAPMPVEKAEGESEYAEDLRSPTNGTFKSSHYAFPHLKSFPSPTRFSVSARPTIVRLFRKLQRF
ncbi:hypothetical protein BDN70DRAFT_895511 [Pholiota conissans]|uniref:HMG box domain-containing protein n=1 Tax=Pholiota conissans TaxID=109636 RepID=A0A9P5Z008_9AGAR|nr:hypothetical protein BDN70DRAFT_895511 [Pholiota conissans]